MKSKSLPVFFKSLQFRGQKRHESRWVTLFFVGLLLLGLLASPDYGLPCDEPAEQVILKENMMEYALHLFQKDSHAFLYYADQGIQPISQSVEKDHGQCAYYPFVPLLSLQNSHPHEVMVLWRAYTWLWFMGGVWALYALARSLGISKPLACACCLLLYLSPRFFAEGHYNNKDVVLLSLFLITLWLGARFLKSLSLPHGFLFSLAGAMAANTKIVGILPWGLMGLAALILVTSRHAWSRRMIGVALATVLSFAVFYTLLTPALWFDPLGYLQHALTNASGFTRWPGVVLFRGFIFDQSKTPLPRSYLPFMIASTLPLYTLPLAIVGQLRALLDAWRAKTSLCTDARLLLLLSATLLWLLPLGYAIVSRTLVYNGWRHFYFIYAGIVLLAGYGIHILFEVLRTRPILHHILAGLLTLCFTLTAIGLVTNHPYQYSYYNVLVGENAENEMELDYWDVCTVNAMRLLASMPTAPDGENARNPSLPLQLGSRDPMSTFGLTWGYPVLEPPIQQALTITSNANAPYLFFNTTYALIYGVPEPQGYRALLTTKSYGNTLCTIYERESPVEGITPSQVLP